MSNHERKPVVKLPPEVVERCRAYADKVAHYRSGDKMEAMPWTHDLMTIETFQQWVASREEAGRAINIETCELGRWKAQDADPYGIRQAMGEFPEEMYQIGTNRFVRSPESRGWVHEGDLPLASAEAMYARIAREWQAYCRANPDDPRVKASAGIIE